MKSLIFLVLALYPHTAASLVAGSALTKALDSTSRPVVVHLWDPKPAALESFAIADVSAACRDAGAAAVLVTPALVSAVAEEQEAHRGSYPGPLPVIADCALNDMIGTESPAELCIGAKSLGASAIGIRYYELDWPDEAALEAALCSAVAAAEQSGLGALLLGEFGADGDEGAAGAVGALASRVGASAALAKQCVEPEKTESGKEGALALGCWDGSAKALERLRGAGFSGLVLKNACDGDISRGARMKSPSLAAQAVTKLVKAALSKGSQTVWAGAGSTSGGESSSASLDSYFNNRG
mmetsp:Transcript_45959/g.75973  ORF Transcript_45959/g.75973 Transcript_45959/m.75973 type:complete len:297 (-) Transcript_45959:173-1063(-)